jgi:pimeloyl-ACP methyl ester carboxylesterase
MTGAPAEHITPYDRLAMDEASMVSMLASRTRHEGLVEYFGAALHAELVQLARATLKQRPAVRRRVYVLPGIMGTQLGFPRGGTRPNDSLWLDPIDISFGRLTELKLDGDSRAIALGAMNYTYLKLTLSLRKAGFDTVLLDYDWRRDLATLGATLAARIAADGRDDVAIVGHSMGGLVARAALTHAAGKQVSQLITLGTPHSGSIAAVQALRGTYSVVRKLGMLDTRHDAEYLASGVFSSFASLHELLPAAGEICDFDLFDRGAWPAEGPGPDPVLLREAAGVAQRLAPADARFNVIVGCNRSTATRVARRDGDFEYEYTLEGDGTVPLALALIAGARHRYVDCGHSDLPLSARVIRGTAELLATGRTRAFAASPPLRRAARKRVTDTQLRRELQGKIDWPHMSPRERREFLDTLNEAPRGMHFSAARAASKSSRGKGRARPKSRKARPRRGR